MAVSREQWARFERVVRRHAAYYAAVEQRMRRSRWSRLEPTLGAVMMARVALMRLAELAASRARPRE